MIETTFPLLVVFLTKTSSSTGFGIIEIFDFAFGNELIIEFFNAELVAIIPEHDS